MKLGPYLLRYNNTGAFCKCTGTGVSRLKYISIIYLIFANYYDTNTLCMQHVKQPKNREN